MANSEAAINSRKVFLEAMHVSVIWRIARRLPSAGQSKEIQMPESPALSEEDVRAILLDLWRKVLEKTDLREDENFFELGGDSVQGMIAVSTIQALLKVEVPMEFLFDSDTIGDLNSRIFQLWLSTQSSPPHTTSS